MPFEIKTIGAAISVTVHDATSAAILSSGLCERLEQLLPAWARDPEIYGTTLTIDRTDQPLADHPAELSDAQRASGAGCVWRLECYSKPTVSLIDCAISGYMAGLVMSGTHRVAGERYAVSVPSSDLLTATDGGLAHRLAHLPAGVGAYLVATGRSIGPSDALAYGLVTHLVPASRFAEIRAGLAGADPVDPLLDDRHFRPARTPSQQTLDQLIAQCFAVPKLAEIRKRFDSADHGSSAIARECLADLEKTAANSPLDKALGLLADATATDLRTALIAGFTTATGAILDLPSRTALQALRNR